MFLFVGTWVNDECQVVMLRSEQLVGILLCVFVSEDIVNNIKNLHLENSKTGLYGLYGNKGALAVRFEYAFTYCFKSRANFLQLQR